MQTGAERTGSPASPHCADTRALQVELHDVLKKRVQEAGARVRADVRSTSETWGQKLLPSPNETPTSAAAGPVRTFDPARTAVSAAG